MSELEGLHERQYKQIYGEDDIPLAIGRPRAIRFALYASVCVVIGLIVAGIVIKIPRQVTMSFVLKSTAAETVYRFQESVDVIEIFPKSGDVVRPGMSLLTITSPSIVGLINALTNAETALTLFEQSDIPILRRQMATLGLEKQKLESQVSDIQREAQARLKAKESEIAKLQLTIETTQKQYDQSKKLRKKGYVAENELRELLLKNVSAKDALVRAKEQYNKEEFSMEMKTKQLTLDRSITGGNTEEIELEITRRRAKLTSDKMSVWQQIRNLYGDVEIQDGGFTIKAKDTLTVTYVNTASKRILQTDVAMKLTKDTKGVYAATSVAPHQIGAMKKGLLSVMKVSTFPHYHWGIVRGIISDISLTPDDSGNYPMQVRIADAGNLRNFLQIGMNGELSVLVEERPIFSYVFEKLLGKVNT